jgi:hypothetical protein
MNRSGWMWIIALVATLASAYWQRTSGPTYELRGDANLGEVAFSYTLERTHAGDGDHRVVLAGLPPDVAGVTEWKHYRSTDPWTAVGMWREEDGLVAGLPHQPPEGKLWYRVRLTRGEETLVIPPDRPVAIRFRGEVPAWILIPHIVFMFAAMLLSTRTGLEALAPRPRLKGLTYGTLATLFLGGMAIGPFVTHYAFGPYWTGFPLGDDLTDSKTLVAFVGWILATIAVSRSRGARVGVVVAALVMLVIFAIPHSWSGGEPSYDQMGARSQSSTQFAG